MAKLDEYWERLSLAPDDLEALGHVEDHLRAERRYDELLHLYEDLAIKVDAQPAAEYMVRAARVALDSVNSSARAEGYLRSAIAADPDRSDARTELRELLLGRGATEDALLVYEDELREHGKSSETAAGWIEIAELVLGKLGDVGRALNALDMAEEADSENVDVYELRGRIHGERGHPRLVYQCLVQELDVGGDTDERVGRFQELIESMVRHPRLHPLVLEGAELLRAYRDDDPVALTCEHEVERFKKTWKQRVLDLDAEAMHVAITDESKAAELWRMEAEIQLAYGEHQDSALVSLNKSLGAAPGDEAGLTLLRDVYEQSGRYGALVDELEKLAGGLGDPARSIELYMQAAGLCKDELGNSAGAARMYRNVLDLDSGHREASEELAYYYLENEKPREAVRVFEQLAENATTGPDQIDARLQLAELFEGELGESPEALAQFEKIIAINPHHARAQATLEAAYRDSEDAEGLVRVLSVRANHGDWGSREAVFRELAELCAGPLDDPLRAIESLAAIYVHEPAAELREKMVALARTEDQLRLAVEGIEESLTGMANRTLKISELKALAPIYEEQLAEPGEALKIVQLCLAMGDDEPGLCDVFERLLQNAAPAGEHAAQWFADAAEAVELPEAKGRARKLEALTLSGNGEDERAAEVWHDVLRLAPGDETAFEELREWYRSAEHFEPLRDLLEQKRGLIDDDVRLIELSLELGSLYEKELEEPDRAALAYCEVLESEANTPRAVTGLERLLDVVDSPVRVASVLRDVYRSQEAWPGVAKMSEVLLEVAEEPAERQRSLRDLSSLFETHLDDALAALRWALVALKEEPGDSELIDQVLRLTGSTRAYEESLESLRAFRDDSEGNVRQRLSLTAANVATWADDRRGGIRDALEACGIEWSYSSEAGRVLEELVSPGPEAEVLRESCVDIIEDMSRDGKVAAWRILAQRFEASWQDLQGAILAWSQLRSLGEQVLACNLELDRLYEAADEPTRWVEHLLSRLEDVLPLDLHLDLGRKLVDTLTDPLEEIDRAIEQAELLGEQAPDQVWIWERLSTLYDEQGSSSGLSETWEREGPLIEEADHRYRRRLDYAQMMSKVPEARADAVRLLREAAEARPGEADALEIMQALRGAFEPTDAFYHSLARLEFDGLERAERWAEACEQISAYIPALEEPREQALLWRRLADNQESQLGESGRALESVCRAFELIPEERLIRVKLEEQGLKAGDIERVVDVMGSVVDREPAGDLLSELRRVRARLYEKELDKPAEALAEWLALSGGELSHDANILVPMERLYRQLDDAEGLCSLLEVVPETLDPLALDAQLSCHYEVAELSEERLSDVPRALRALERAALIAANPMRALNWQAKILRAGHDHHALLDVLEGLTRPGLDNPERLEHLLEKAKLHHELGEYGRARELYTTVLDEQHDYLEAREGLEGLVEQGVEVEESARRLEPVYTVEHDYQKLVWVLSKRLDVAEEPDKRKILMRRIGEHYETHLDRPQQAFEMARSILLEDPTDIGVRVWFEQLAERLGLNDELASTYVELATKSSPPNDLQYHRWAAKLFEDKLGDLDRAAEQYRAILKLRDHDERALMGLEAIYRKTNQPAELVDIMRQRIDTGIDVDQHTEYLRQIARLELEDLGVPLDAAKTLLELYQLAPERLGVFDSLESLYEDHEQWGDLVELYSCERERLGTLEGGESWENYRTLSFRQAAVLFSELDDPFTAAALFEALLDDDEPHEPTLAFLEEQAAGGNDEFIRLLLEHYGRLGSWPELLRMLRVKLEHLDEPKAKRDTLLEIARIEEMKMERPAEAIEAVGTAFEQVSSETDLLRGLYQTAERTGAFGPWFETMRRVLPKVESVVERRGFMHAMGTVARQELQDPTRAIEVYNQLLEEHPEDEAALAALDGLYEEEEQWAERAAIMERRLKLTDDVFDRRGLGESLAAIYEEKLGESASACRVYERLRDDDPSWLQAHQRLESLYRGLENWPDLERCLLAQIELCEEDVERLRLKQALAELYQHELADPERAISGWRDVLAQDATHARAIGALDELLTARGDQDALVELLGHIIAHVPSELGHVLTHRRRARLLRDDLNRPDEAAGDWRALLAWQADDLESLVALSDIYERAAEWALWTELTERRLSLVDDGTQALRVKFAEVMGAELGQRAEAEAELLHVLREDVVPVVLLETLADVALGLELPEVAAEALERAAREVEQTSDSQRLYQRAVQVYSEVLGRPDDARRAWEAIAEITGGDLDSFEALRGIYRRAELFSDLVELHEKMLPSLAPEVRVGALREIVDAQRGPLENPDMAFVTACRLYREQPDDVEVSDILETLASELGCLDEVVALIEDRVDGIVDSRVRLELFMKLGRLHDVALSEPDEAEVSYERALEIEPAHSDALDGLMKLAVADERFDKQLNILERKIRGAESIESKRELLWQMAEIWEEEIGDESRTVATLERIRLLLPNDLAALEWLCRLHRGLSHFEPLVEILQHWSEIATEPEELVPLYRELGTVSEQKLDSPSDAIGWLEKLIEIAPRDVDGWEQLAVLYEQTGRYGELLKLLEHQLTYAQGADEEVGIHRRRAEISETQLSNLPGAAESLRSLLEVAPDDIEAIEALCRVLRGLEDWPELIEWMRRQADVVAGDPDARARVFLELGEVYHNHLARVDLAEQAYNEARLLIPDSSEALHALGQLYERSGNWFQALEMLEHEAELVAEPQLSAQLFERIGRINEEMLLNTSGAVEAYQKAIGKFPGSLAALEALKTMAREDEDWGGYARYLEMILDAVTEPDDRFELLVEMAQHKEAIEHDDLKAIDLYEEAAEIDSSELECILELAELHFRCEQWVDAGKWYRHAIELMGPNADGQIACQAHYRLGYTCEKLEKFEQALSCYQQAVHADPTSLPALEALAQMLLGLERFEEAREAFEKIISHHRAELTESEVVDIHWQLGELAMRLNDPAAAGQSYEMAVTMDPNHVHSLQALGNLDVAAERWESAYQLLDRYSRLIVESEREPVLMQLADIALEHLGEGKIAIDVLSRGIKSAGPELLERLGRMYLASDDQQRAAHCLSRAVDAASDVQTISRLAYELGQLYDKQLGNEVLAIDAYNKALDAQPTNTRAFEDIEALLVKRQEWRLLEQNYRAMLTRSRELSPRFRLVLWRHLASLYAKVFDDVDNAIMAYEVVGKMAPASLEDQYALAGLYGRRDDLRERAIELEHGFLGEADELVGGIRRLKQLYHREADFDAVYQCCAVLHALDSTDEDEFETFRHLGRGLKSWPDGALNDEIWARLFPECIHGPVGELAAELYRHAPDAFIEDDKRAGIKRREVISLESDLFVAGVVRGVLRALGLPPLRLVLRRRSMEPIKLAHVRPLALMIGENNDLVQSTDQRMTRFLVGQNVAYSRPELFLIRRYPAEQLRELLLGFCTVYNRGLEVSSHSGISSWADRFEKLPGEVLRLLQETARRAYPELMTGKATQALSMAAEQTSARAGLLACGDMSAGLRGLAQSPSLVAGQGQAERARGLLDFGASKEYLRICKAMGQTLTVVSGQNQRAN